MEPQGQKDEPQHLTKGLITRDLLRLLGIKFCVLKNTKDLNNLSKLINHSKKNKTPVACLIKKDTFPKNKIKLKEEKKIILREITL